jgi:PAS domain S-box-containing protein
MMPTAVRPDIKKKRLADFVSIYLNQQTVMTPAAIPSDEEDRLRALAEFRILDTPPEEALDELTRLASLMCGTPTALISLIDSTRQWFKSKVGLTATQGSRDDAFCAHAILGSGVFTVEDASSDARFADHPSVIGQPGIRFYAGAPLATSDGKNLGTLCVIDRVPRKLTADQQAGLVALSRQVMFYLEMRRELAELRGPVQDHREARPGQGDIADGSEAGEKKHRVLERRFAEQYVQLRESRERFRIFMDNSPALAWVKDGYGRFLYANEKLGKLLASSSSDLIGKGQGEILAPAELAVVSANDRMVIESGRPHQFEERVSDANGVRRDWLVYKFPLPGENGQQLCGGMAVDITERNLLDAKNRASDLKVRAIYESAFQFIGLLDPNGIVLEANATALGFINQPLSAVTGKLLWETAWWSGSTQEQQRCKDAVTRAAAGETVRLTTQHHSPDGQTVDIDFSLKPLRDEAGVITHLIPEGRDITEIKQLQRQTAAARETADAANLAKSEFLANMSHEIRTPLTAILGSAERLGRVGCDVMDREEFTGIILRNARNLLDLVNDILDLSKIEAGKTDVEARGCEPAVVIAEVMATLRGRAVEKGLTFESRFTTAMPPRIQTDPTKLRQILVNLIGNAIKFTDQGSVLVEAGFERREKTGVLRIGVKDTGIGIPPTKLDKLFQAFSQADDSITRRFGGTGLGLVISRRLALLLGGDIEVESEAGIGSLFTLWVPGGEMATAEWTSLRAGNQMSETGDLIAAEEIQFFGRILLAEDGRDNQRLISALLRDAGAEVVLASNGKIAVNLATRQSFDLILMDIQMPEMDGRSATRELRRLGIFTPIIALTAHAMAEDKQKCLECGCNDYLSKPIDHATFLRVVAAYLKPARSLPEKAADDGSIPVQVADSSDSPTVKN